MLLWRTLFLAIVHTTILVTASPTNPSSNRFVNFGSALLNNSLSPANVSTSSISSLSSQIVVQCLPNRYGKDLPFGDCVDAVGQIAPDDEEEEWWPREFDIKKQHFPLPFMFMGRDARCYIQPQLAPGAQKGRASLLQIAEAADRILAKCSGNNKINGGIAQRIGGNNALNVVMGLYRGPTPTCRGVVRDETLAAQCRAPLDGMEASTESIMFAPVTDPKPGADVRLPAYVRAPGDACVLRVFGVADTGNWYQLWQAAVSVFSTCVRNAKGGSVIGLGDTGRLFLTLTSPISLLRNASGVGTAES